MYYHICPHCGASLDPGKTCDCKKEKRWYRMKTYKEFPKRYIGESDSAYLLLRSAQEEKQLTFGEDGFYSAYIVNDSACEIPDFYKKVFECSDQLEVRDDFEKSTVFKGEKIEVYRAGEFGCIIIIGVEQHE